ncbi:hypothetical protein [Actinoplanes sp. HUAS TT8]|uniref:hypothetical protein n=1 Tax=Actinoplanes sp. HUAS TT8 TaxID=3447453 RepID=UPI003F520F87
MKFWDWPLALMVLVFAAPIVAGGAVLYTRGWDEARAYFVGESGQVAPFRDCEWVPRTNGDKDEGWECRGVFTGGGLRVNDVRLTPRLPERPTGPVPAIVSGPSATTAWTTSGAEMLFAATAGVVLMAISPTIGVLQFRKEIAAAYRKRRSRRDLTG